VELRIPPLSLCTDNGAMIAAIGAERIMKGFASSALDSAVDSTMPASLVQM
jgi:N6-L-threonylcarbamoyladenine synthase